MSNQTHICPNCREAIPNDAPEGVCPACALRAGFGIENGHDSPTRLTPAPETQPLAIDQLASQLPELEQFELIGRGGMGSVYKARHRELDRPVAVKVLDSALSGDASFAERFTREARTLARLDHANVVRVYDFGHRDDLYYLIMELVDGVSLRQTIEAGTLQPQEALSMVPHICEALQYAHDQGVVHRDIKPENILVDRSGSIKIADFGLAKMVGREAGHRLTRTRQIMGTPVYMAPEQIESPGNVDHRADIFALGVVFYELLTGELPVGRFPPPSRKVQVDVRLDDVVLRTLEKEPGLRYQQASELGSDVESISTGGALGAGRTPDRSAGIQADRRNDPQPLPKKHQGIDYRSKRTMFGLPLVHICSSGDPTGKRLSTASGIIAIGDIAIGGVAIGAFSFGGIAIGGMGIGIVGIGGCLLGLLAALGGCTFAGFAVGGLAFGGYAVGSLAFGLIGASGLETHSHMVISEATRNQLMLAGWLTLTVGATIGAMAAINAWIQYVKAKNEKHDAR